MNEIKFISYSGDSDDFCSGQLEVEIDGFPYSFGSVSDGDDFERFWTVGRCVKDDQKLCHLTWRVDDFLDGLDLVWFKPNPEWIKELHPELIKVMNENVKIGYCEGCWCW